MKRQTKKYSKPRKPFDKIRIEEENILVERYGLENKREIWKADSAIGRMRNLAKELITGSDEEKNLFIERLQKKGFGVNSIADVLALDKEDWLKRRLQTIVHQKKFAHTPKQARQFITHRHVLIDGKFVNKPSYQVGLEEEGVITSNVKLVEKQKKKSKIEEIKEGSVGVGGVQEGGDVKVEAVKEEPSAEVKVESGAEVKVEAVPEKAVEEVKEEKVEVKEEAVEEIAEKVQEVNEKPIEVEAK